MKKPSLASEIQRLLGPKAARDENILPKNRAAAIAAHGGSFITREERALLTLSGTDAEIAAQVIADIDHQRTHLKAIPLSSEQKELYRLAQQILPEAAAYTTPAPSETPDKAAIATTITETSEPFHTAITTATTEEIAA